MMDKAQILALADRVEDRMLGYVRLSLAGTDGLFVEQIQFAANCATVAASLRAMAGGQTNA